MNYDLDEMTSTPAGFGRVILGLDMYPKQEDIVNEFWDQHGRVKVSVRAPNGSGKSSVIIPTLALRNLQTKPQGRVIITSKDSRQLDEQVWPALESHRGKFTNLEWYQRYILSKEGGFIIGFTTDDPARAEGWHAKIEPPSLDSPVTIICDEAKSIPDPIFEAFSGRCTFNALLYISSTGELSGAFARSQDKGSDFIRYHITYEDCEHVLDKKRVEALQAFYPADDPFLRSTLYAEFMDHTGDAGRFTSLAVIRKWLENPPEERSGDTVAFCDFAGGGAENVLAIRRGNRVRILKAWREVNEMVAIGEFIALFREQNLKPHQIYGDNAGAGKPMVARMAELGWEINRFNGQSPALRESDFSDRNAEVWYTAGREVGKGKLILPNDPILHDQMVQRKRGADPKGRIRAESKDAMANRGLKSPDRADAVMAVIAIKPLLFNSKLEDQFGFPDLEELEEENPRSFLEAHNIHGAEAGV
jgi:phage terminase large subunit